MIKNLLIVGGGIFVIVVCITAIVLAIKNYIILNKAYKKTNKRQEEKLNDAMRFYLLATQLKYKIRSGWDETHWNVSKERIESIAEHVYLFLHIIATNSKQIYKQKFIRIWDVKIH